MCVTRNTIVSATGLLMYKLNLPQCHKFRNSYKIKNYFRILTHVRCLIITCIIISCNCDVRERGICSQLLSQPQNIHSCNKTRLNDVMSSARFPQVRFVTNCLCCKFSSFVLSLFSHFTQNLRIDMILPLLMDGGIIL